MVSPRDGRGMEDCPFCEIAAGDRDAHVVADAERTMAFLDTNPAVRGHTLVVPRAHRECLFTEESGVAAAVFGTVQRVAAAMDRSLDADGVSTFYTTGDLTGTVTHAHVHLLPRRADDGVHLALSRDALDDETGAALAGRIRDAL